MKNFKGEIIIRPKESDKVQEVATYIHDQLVGNKDYKESNIGIYFNDTEVLVWFDRYDCEGKKPEIKF